MDVSLHTGHSHRAETRGGILGSIVTRDLTTILGLTLASVASPAFALTVRMSGSFITTALVAAAALGLVGGGLARVVRLPIWVGLSASAAVAILIALGQHFVLRALADDVRFFDEISEALAAGYKRLAVTCGVILTVACFVGYRLAKRWQRRDGERAN